MSNFGVVRFLKNFKVQPFSFWAVKFSLGMIVTEGGCSTTILSVQAEYEGILKFCTDVTREWENCCVNDERVRVVGKGYKGTQRHKQSFV